MRKVDIPQDDLRRLFLCTWYQPIHDLGKRRLYSQLHKVRDGLASAYVSALLTESGYRLSGTVVNVPDALPTPRIRYSRLEPIDKDKDLIWIPTRLPLDDNQGIAKVGKRRLRIVDRSKTPLEERILSSFRPYFEMCCRTRIALSSAIDLDTPGRSYRISEFREFSGAVLVQHGAAQSRLHPPRADRTTLGYFIALPGQEGLGRLVAAFGAGGTETLLFTQLLTTAFRAQVTEILNRNKPWLLFAKFFVPEYVSAPLLAYSIEELEPQLLANQPIP